MSCFESYVICTSPRSGSTLLCKLLAETSVAGVPESYFHRPSMSSWLNAFELTVKDDATEQDIIRSIVRSAIAKGRRDDGLFGLRLQRHSAKYLIEKLGVLHPECLSVADRFHAAFGNTAFVHLSRGDKVEQAVSHVKAEQTGLWHIAPDGTELERQSPPTAPSYDADRILARLVELSNYDQQWVEWFAMEKLDPIQVTYENLSARPIETLAGLLNQLGLDGGAAAGIVPSVAKLADGVNRDWVARFRSEFPEFSSM